MSAKGKVKAAVIEDVTDEDVMMPQAAADDDFDVDNMDFDLPASLVPQQSSSGYEPLLQTPSEALQRAAQAQAQARTQNQSLPRQQPQQSQIDPALRQAMKTWTTIYPIYLNSSASHSRGRRVPKELGVKNPSIIFLGDCVKQLGFHCVVEMGKRHPRDPLTFGRVKVNLALRGVKKTEFLVQLAKVYPEVEARMLKEDPMRAAQAAASRSEMSRLVQETYKEAKEIKEGGEGKAGKKKKGKK
ncbi:hypothetical protein HDV05_003086 [Chytridiales sp. JEL 0842]|nr:hypothetical protein HDV05_003086 [Chytridiales sp. JEL 0842]